MNQREKIKMPPGHGEKVRQSLLGKKEKLARNWKGDKAGYVAIHTWLRKKYGRATKCENPDCKSKNPKRYEWASISRKWKRDRNDYIQLCPPCHRKFDMTAELLKKIVKNLKYVK